MPFMREGIFMNQKIIEVLLTGNNEEDFLVFKVNDKNMTVNLNSPTCQGELKNLFSNLLGLLIKDDIELVLAIDDDYSRQMYIEVCEEYIKDLNRELNECKSELRRQVFKS